jgi:hypothetical protein
MQGNCPRCQTRLEFPNSGVYQCERCNARFEISLGAPAPPSAPTQSYPTPESPLSYNPNLSPPVAPPPGWPAVSDQIVGDAPCAGHPANPASRVCERCGDFMCRLCTTHVEGRAYCPKCFDLLYNRGALGFTQRQFGLPGITLTLGICSIVGFFVCMVVIGFVLAIPCGIAGIATGVRALKHYQERPELPGKAMNTWGMWLSGIGLALGIANVGVFIWIAISN